MFISIFLLWIVHLILIVSFIACSQSWYARACALAYACIHPCTFTRTGIINSHFYPKLPYPIFCLLYLVTFSRKYHTSWKQIINVDWNRWTVPNNYHCLRAWRRLLKTWNQRKEKKRLMYLDYCVISMSMLFELWPRNFRLCWANYIL